MKREREKAKYEELLCVAHKIKNSQLPNSEWYARQYKDIFKFLEKHNK